VGESFEISWTITNLTPVYQEVALFAQLPKPETPGVGVGGSPFLGTTNAVCYSHLSIDGRWIPYPPATCQRIASAIFASPRGGRLSLDGTAANTTPATTTATTPATTPSATPAPVAVPSNSPATTTTALEVVPATYEIRWGIAELRGVKFSSSASAYDHVLDADGMINQIAQVNTTTGNARLVKKHASNAAPLPKSHCFGGTGGGIAGGMGGSSAAFKTSTTAASQCLVGGGLESDSFLWSGIKKCTVTIDPDGAGVKITHTLIARRSGRLPLPQLDGYSARLGAFVVKDSANPPTTMFISPLPRQLPTVEACQP
jgi:hypothetical protein